MRLPNVFLSLVFLLSPLVLSAEISDNELAARIMDKTDEFDKTRMVYVQTPDFIDSESSKGECIMAVMLSISPKRTLTSMSFANYTGSRAQIQVYAAKLLINDEISDLKMMGEPRRVRSSTGAMEEDVMILLDLFSLKNIVSSATAKVKLYGENGSFIYTLGPNQKRYINVFLTYLKTNVLP
jgi:hypothetical protein